MDGRQMDETYKLNMAIIDTNRERRMSDGMSKRADTEMAQEIDKQRTDMTERHQWAKAMYGNDLKPSALDTQVGGSHYQKMGAFQPWSVLRAWLTPEEFRGYMKGTAIAYLAREKDKGGMVDIEKATHTLQGLVELTK